METHEALRKAQMTVVFRNPDGLPSTVPEERTLPNLGTNISTFFGEDALASLELSEEQLDFLDRFRWIPLSLLERTVGGMSDGSAFNTISFTMQQQLNIGQQAIQRLKNAHLSPAELTTLHGLAIAEKRASLPVIQFHQFCQNLQTKLTSIPQTDRAVLMAPFDTVIKLENAQPREHFEGVASALFFSHTTLDSVSSVVKVLSALDSELCNIDMPTLVEELCHATDETKSRFMERTFGNAGSVKKEHILSAQLNLDTSYAGATLECDADIIRYLLDLPRQRECSDVEFLNLVYSYTTEYTARTVSVTPAEIILTRLTSQMISRVSAYLLVCTLAVSYLYRFCIGSRKVLGALIERCCTNWRQLSRVGELLGATHDSTQSALTTLMDQLFLTINSEQFTSDSLASALQFSSEYTSQHPESRVWSYESSQRPWMPSVVRNHLSSVGALHMFKSDIPLLSMHSSDLWVPLKWAGLSTENLTEIQSLATGTVPPPTPAAPRGLAEGLLKQSIASPELHSKALVALLALSGEPLPLFFGTEDAAEAALDIGLPETIHIEEDIEEDWPVWDESDEE